MLTKNVNFSHPSDLPSTVLSFEISGHVQAYVIASS